MGQIPTPIQAKRRGARVSAIKRKAERGETTGNERALMRVGKGTTRILTGQEDLSQWEDEELRMGQKRAKNGRFSGAPPKIVPKAVHDELVRRTLANAQNLMRENLETAVQVLVEIIQGQDTEDKDRLRAISMIMDRVMGKAPERVEVSVEKPWMQAITEGIVPFEQTILEVDSEEADDDEGED